MMHDSKISREMQSHYRDILQDFCLFALRLASCDTEQNAIYKTTCLGVLGHWSILYWGIKTYRGNALLRMKYSPLTHGLVS